MKIYVDENMPYGKEFFGLFGEVIPFAGRDLSAEAVKDADILLVRSITNVNSRLLALNENIKFVGTATIGTDHIDLDYLKQHNIGFSSSPGCNKVSVAEYVLSSLLVLAEKQQFNLTDKRVAIVGAGNTGSAVHQVLTGLGVDCILYDPPLAAAGERRTFCEFNEVLESDIISLHVPKVTSGEYKTTHLFDREVLEQLSSKQILINACRGEVIDNQALLTLAKADKAPCLVLDVWENEPNIETQLLSYVTLATPHIAGYSVDGRVRGTEMLYQALCEFLGEEPVLSSRQLMTKPSISEITVDAPLTSDLVKSLVHVIYDVRRDDALFREKVNNANGFDHMRKNYPERRELSTVTINLSERNYKMVNPINLSKIGFNTHIK